MALVHVCKGCGSHDTKVVSAEEVIDKAVKFIPTGESGFLRSFVETSGSLTTRLASLVGLTGPTVVCQKCSRREKL